MAGWGTGSFENEHAQKWLSQLHSIPAAELQDILARARDTDYLEAPEASIVVTAAEVVAAANGMPVDDIPPEISAWVGPNPAPPSAMLRELSLGAVEKVRKNSELRDLWHQAEGLNEWTDNLRRLEERLRSSTA